MALLMGFRSATISLRQVRLCFRPETPNLKTWKPKTENQKPKTETLFGGLRVGFRKATLSLRQGVKLIVSHGGSVLL